MALLALIGPAMAGTAKSRQRRKAKAAKSREPKRQWGMTGTERDM
jgi:hypothetical protein